MSGSEYYRLRKYRDDTAFQAVNKKYLTLQEEERRVNNEHLKSVIEQKLIPLMRKNELFDIMYSRIMYGGSYYKGTKYGKPEEFDLDYILKLPVDYSSKITIQTDPNNYGFVKIKVDLSSLRSNWEKHRPQLQRLLTYDNYFDQSKFRCWMENVFTSAFNEYVRTGRGFQISCNGKTYLIKHRKSGPAFTMIITTPSGSVIDVDLVPAFEFSNNLGNGYKSFNGQRRTWMVVAKPLSSRPQGGILWRLCFYEQEKEFLEGPLKPVIRMMKKFRDTKNWKSIASYYIETVFYHELESHRGDMQNYLRAPKTYLFMTVLKRLHQALEKRHLAYFWHPSYNLFDSLNQHELMNIANNLSRIIKEIDDNIETDPWILAKKILTPIEYSNLNGNLEANMANLRLGTNSEVTHSTSSNCIIM